MRRLLCALFGHTWDEWVRIPETMTIVSGCRRCPEIRTARYEAIVPASVAEAWMREVMRPNPYRVLHTAPSFRADADVLEGRTAR